MNRSVRAALGSGALVLRDRERPERTGSRLAAWGWWLCCRSGRVGCDCACPAAGREAVGLLEPPGQVALVGKTGVRGSLRERDSAFDRGPGQVEAAPDPVLVGADPERPAKVAGQSETVGAGNLLKGLGRGLVAGVGREVLPRELDGPCIDQDAAVTVPPAEHAERISDGHGDISAGQVADWAVDVG